MLTTDRLTAAQRAANRLFLGERSGWGLGLAVPAAGVDQVLDPSDPVGFGWDGGTGTAWRSDPERNLTGILFSQHEMVSPEPPEVFVDFWSGVYDAVET